MAVKEKGIGRGLDVLLFNNNTNKTEEPLLNKNEQIIKLPILQVQPNKYQPRKTFNEESIKELASSIKAQGILHPIIARQLNPEQYEIASGERRWRAAQSIGMIDIPVVIRHLSDTDMMTIALIENIQREALNPLEEAFAIQQLLKKCQLTQEQVAEALSRSRSSITNLIRLLELENEVKELLKSGIIEMGHARALLTLEREEQISAANIIVSKHLSVRQTEDLVQKIKFKDTSITNLSSLIIDHDKVNQWSTVLSHKLDTAVKVHVTNKGKGRVVIQFDNVDALNHFIEKVKFEA